MVPESRVLIFTLIRAPALIYSILLLAATAFATIIRIRKKEVAHVPRIQTGIKLLVLLLVILCARTRTPLGGLWDQAPRRRTSATAQGPCLSLVQQFLRFPLRLGERRRLNSAMQICLCRLVFL